MNTPVLASALLPALACLWLLTRNLVQIDVFSWGRVTIFFVSAKTTLKSVGGVWFGIVGAPLAAWFITTFFILPLIGINGYVLNIQTVFQLTNPTAVLIFLALWLSLAFGFFGASVYKRNGSRK